MWWRRHKKLAVALTCADWRLHQHSVDLNRRLARKLGVNGVDLIAVPGPDGLHLAERAAEWQATLGQIKLLLGAHAPVAVAVVAHQRCAGHPVSDDAHNTDVRIVAEVLKKETGFTGKVAAIVAGYKSDAHWTLDMIAQF